MTPRQYKRLRQGVGSQRAVAKMLGVHPQTISKRERGELPIDSEAALSIQRLAEKVRP